MTLMSVVVAAVGVLAVAASAVIGTRVVGLSTTPTPTSLPIVTPSALPTPSLVPSVNMPTSLPTPWVQGLRTDITPIISPLPTPTISKVTPTPRVASPSPVTESTSANAHLGFGSTPSRVGVNESFVVELVIDGPEGKRGEEALVKLSFDKSSQNGGSSTSISNNSSNSFGSFTTPRTFRSTYSFGSIPGTMHLEASAVVDGETLTANKDVELVD